ncbi:hypothetical protein KSS87_016633 [Heliosperma pusillum]|nr:hypothetical protein KSS87_018121 [Heliosperma pusillum]KAH9624130.1 hypothetical protein KSS87_016633 [Heliosperma pusillum]
MVGTNLKAETVKLMDERSLIETEINNVIQRLCHPAGPGLSGNLVDFEGFPRTDIDIPTVCADRRRLSELKNDHRDITEKINHNIQLLHAAKPRPKPSVTSTSGEQIFSMPQNQSEITTSGDDINHYEKTKNCMAIDSQSSMSNGTSSTSSDHVYLGSNRTAETDVIAYIPFALVDEIAESSPAAEDGLQLGDQIVKFGSVESGENMLAMIAQEVQRSQGTPISVSVMRHGAFSSLSVTPRTWQGRGLLGYAKHLSFAD